MYMAYVQVFVYIWNFPAIHSNDMAPLCKAFGHGVALDSKYSGVMLWWLLLCNAGAWGTTSRAVWLWVYSLDHLPDSSLSWGPNVFRRPGMASPCLTIATFWLLVMMRFDMSLVPDGCVMCVNQDMSGGGPYRLPGVWSTVQSTQQSSPIRWGTTPVRRLWKASSGVPIPQRSRYDKQSPPHHRKILVSECT